MFLTPTTAYYIKTKTGVGQGKTILLHLVVCGAKGHMDGHIFSDFMGYCMALCFVTDAHYNGYKCGGKDYDLIDRHGNLPMGVAGDFRMILPFTSRRRRLAVCVATDCRVGHIFSDFMGYCMA